VPKRGLPEALQMRHDAHYVEALASSAAPPIGRLVPIERVDPNPDQPRQAMGDLSDLVASLAEKGIIEPLIVRQRGDRYQIIAGERRYQAAIRAGLVELPVVVRDVDDTEMLELALVENIQRKDLTAFEEAEALQSLTVRCGYTHEDLAKRLGKSRTSITESLSLTTIPTDVRKVCRLARRSPRTGRHARSFAVSTRSPNQVLADPALTCSASGRPPRRSTCALRSPRRTPRRTK
jgi:ParB family transcriptional regulator, chromosome partitioning protein